MIEMLGEQLLLEAAIWRPGPLETQMNANVRRWKPLPSKDSEDVTVDIRVCVIVNCKLKSHVVCKCAISIQNPSVVTISGDIITN
jgi:hypothetical protein